MNTKYRITLKRRLLLGALASFLFVEVTAQNNDQDYGQIHGNVSVTMQQYNEDTLINAAVPDPGTAMNAFTNLLYTRGNFRAGIRYESYLNRLEGYPQEFSGTGLGYRFASFTNEELDITVGNFYDQFGNGLILRSYQEPTLGIDNAMDGIKVKVKAYKGVYIKGLYGKMRVGFDGGLINSDGIVRGLDGEVSLNELFDKKLEASKHRINLGGSFVSKFQRDEDPDLVLPENVGSWAYRLNYNVGGYSFNAEYAEKINDPSFDNGYIYKPGKALLINTAYSTKGFGIVLDYKYNDNMSYRVNRDAKLTNALIGFLPALTRPHTYNLAATLYPYAVQLNGEVAYQGNISYQFKRGSKIGGKYGMTLSLNYSVAWGLDSTINHNSSNPRYGYEANFLVPGEERYFQDFNVQLERKFNKNLKVSLMYLNFIYNNDINQGARDNNGTEVHGNIHANIYIADVKYKIDRKNSINAQLQVLTTGKVDDHGTEKLEHQGHWATAILEYTRSPHWFVAILDQYNFANPENIYRIHYLLGSVGYINGGNRLTVSYGKQRAGLFCVGGVCRTVPASNGVTVTLSSTF